MLRRLLAPLKRPSVRFLAQALLCLFAASATLDGGMLHAAGLLDHADGAHAHHAMDLPHDPRHIQHTDHASHEHCDHARMGQGSDQQASVGEGAMAQAGDAHDLAAQKAPAHHPLGHCPSCDCCVHHHCCQGVTFIGATMAFDESTLGRTLGSAEVIPAGALLNPPRRPPKAIL